MEKLLWPCLFVAFTCLVSFVSHILCQRPLRPIGYFDMNMHDAAELCKSIDVDAGKKEATIEQFMPEGDKCFFFQWQYCPNVPESIENPCGWWEQKPCNYTKPPRRGHNHLKPMNPEGLALEDPPKVKPIPAPAGTDVRPTRATEPPGRFGRRRRRSVLMSLASNSTS